MALEALTNLKHKARTRIVGCLNKARPLPTNLSPAEYKAVKLLKEDDLIVIAPADKGNATIVINSEDYDENLGPFWQAQTPTDTYKGLEMT